jgi:hypothetical protein
VVDGLVRRGLVELQQGSTIVGAHRTSDDRRGTTVAADPGSTAIAGSAMVTGLTSQERQQLVQLLRRCTENLYDRQTQDQEPVEHV